MLIAIENHRTYNFPGGGGGGGGGEVILLRLRTSKV